VSLGYNKWNPLDRTLPQLSAWGLGGVQKDNVSVFGGVHTGFDLHDHMVPFAGVLLGLKHKQFTGYLRYNLQRSLTKKKGEEKVQQGSTEKPPERTVENKSEVKVSFESTVNDSLSVFGNVHHDLHNLKSALVGAEYDLGGDTKLKGKVNTYLIK